MMDGHALRGDSCVCGSGSAICLTAGGGIVRAHDTKSGANKHIMMLMIDGMGQIPEDFQQLSGELKAILRIV